MTGDRNARFNQELSDKLRAYLEVHEAVTKGCKIFNTYFSREELGFLHYMVLRSGEYGFTPGVILERTSHSFYDKLLAAGIVQVINDQRIEITGRFRMIKNHYDEHGSLDYNLYTGPIG